jgi:predicted pyridoxine 5'-phosphate oxidase superfamily flavin-nucleotide-binding protein
MAEQTETYLEVLTATEFVAIVTSGNDGPHLVGTWGEYIRRLGADAETIVIPAGGYRQTESNLTEDNRISLLIASRRVPGSSGPGQACEITGTAEVVTEGPVADGVQSEFPWARGALVVSIQEISQHL